MSSSPTAQCLHLVDPDDSGLRDWLTGRAARARHALAIEQQVLIELNTWREVLAAELRATAFTLAEAITLAAITNGHIPSSGMVACGTGFIFAEMLTAAHDRDDSPYHQYHVEEGLLTKLRALGPAADLALEDALARWHHEQHPATPAGFTAVGLTITQPAQSHDQTPDTTPQTPAV